MLVIERKMYLADTDATGFVYYARYLEWMEACRLDILTAIGSGLDQLKTSGINAVVRSAACEYKAPIKLSDTVQIQCFIKKLGKVSVNFGYNFINATSGKLAGTGEVSVVFINNDTLRPVKIPEILLSGLKQFISSNE